MKTKKIAAPYFRAVWLRVLMLFLASNFMLFGCEQAQEEISPGIEKISSTQVQSVRPANAKEDKDEKYKTDKSGQYVSKDVQVTGFEDGSERPVRPKYDRLSYSASRTDSYNTSCVDCEMIIAPEDGAGGGSGTYTPPPAPTSTFISSEGFGYAYYPNHYEYNPSNYIQDLKITKGKSSSVGTMDGYYKINADLNRGAGGQYIYLQFTRDPYKVKGSKAYPGGWVNSDRIGRLVPVRGIDVVIQNYGPANGWPDDWTPPIEVEDALGFHTPDLNDGAGGKYIYAFQRKDSWNTSLPYVKEVGVIYGNSSSIEPPAGWTKIPGDLNAGAGGDYIYFCVKYK